MSEELKPLLNSILEAVQVNSAKLDALDMRVGSLEGKVGSLEGKVGSLECKVGTLEGKMDTFEEKMGTLEGKMGTFEEKMGALEGKVGTFEKKLDSLENEVRSLKTEVGENTLRLTRIEKKQNQLIEVTQMGFCEVNSSLDRLEKGQHMMSHRVLDNEIAVALMQEEMDFKPQPSPGKLEEVIKKLGELQD